MRWNPFLVRQLAIWRLVSIQLNSCMFFWFKSSLRMLMSICRLLLSTALDEWTLSTSDLLSHSTDMGNSPIALIHVPKQPHSLRLSHSLTLGYMKTITRELIFTFNVTHVLTQSCSPSNSNVFSLTINYLDDVRVLPLTHLPHANCR